MGVARCDRARMGQEKVVPVTRLSRCVYYNSANSCLFSSYPPSDTIQIGGKRGFSHYFYSMAPSSLGHGVLTHTFCVCVAWKGAPVQVSSRSERTCGGKNKTQATEGLSPMQEQEVAG